MNMPGSRKENKIENTGKWDFLGGPGASMKKMWVFDS